MSRAGIYYWKCDRPAAFHGTGVRGEAEATIEPQLRRELTRRFETDSVELSPGGTQGNHLTWRAQVGDQSLFIRVENGPEGDPQLEVESRVLESVSSIGVRVPRVFAVDATRTRVPFAWQALECLTWTDLNECYKLGTLDVREVAYGIGRAVALWQQIQPDHFGPFDQMALGREGVLRGYHARYTDYFHLRLDAHLEFLRGREFLTDAECIRIRSAIAKHAGLLDIARGCLVHKDLALWNVMGTAASAEAFIDFDDAIAGDPMDDLSLLGCFHDGAFVSRALEGYESVRALPDAFLQRFWLHLLRNMLVKSVIRVGAGYFERDSRFFLIGSGASGADLRTFTLNRLCLAVDGLLCAAPLSTL